MPREIRATIAQISDLHINRKVKLEGGVVGMLRLILPKLAHSPDVFIVSGDLANQPLPWQMKKAAKLVRQLERQCQAKLTIVIPGNHDYKFWGNGGLRRLTRIPFEIYFRRQGLDHNFWWRVGQTIKLGLNALWWKGKQMREPVTMDVLGNISSAQQDATSDANADATPAAPGVVVFTINSNTLDEMMAGGQVEAQDLQDLFARLDYEQKAVGFEFLFKIAVVHHHPAPIADAPYDSIARIQDSFMIFYNAGLFVRELSRRGFNLVLHGHKHVAGYLRVQCEFEDQGRTVLPIAAAGTATHPAPDDTRGHHLRVVRIYDDDTAELEERFFGADVEKKDGSSVYSLQTLDDVRDQRNRIFGRLKKYVVGEIRKEIAITLAGYSDIKLSYRQCRITAPEGLTRIPVSLITERPSYLRGLKRTEDSAPFGDVKPEETSDLYRIAGDFDLSKLWKQNDGTFQYGYSYRLMNGHVLTKDEFARHYRSKKQDSEWASVTADVACDLLTLDVQFPSTYDVNGLQFRAVAEYVPAPLKGTNDDRLDKGLTKKHDEETERISGNIRKEGNGYVLTCPQPMPGMIYKLCWSFPAAAHAPTPLSATAMVRAAQEKLLNAAATALSAKPDARLAQVQALLIDLGNDINANIVGSNERFDISLMVFDEESNRLKFVGANGKRLPKGDFYSGEGCAGFAFEKASSILYHPARDKIGYFVGRGERQTEAEINEPEVLASVPWIHASQEHSQIVVGVVNVSTALKTTALLQFFDLPEADLSDKMLKLQDLCNLWVRELLSDV